jgi:hypothetical protein
VCLLLLRWSEYVAALMVGHRVPTAAKVPDGQRVCYT